MVTAFAVPGLPLFGPGDDVAGAITAAATLRDGDVVVVTSKVLSRVQGRMVDLRRVTPGPGALALAEEVGKDPRLVELILAESVAVSRKAPGVLVVRHENGIVSANAGIDRSNTRDPGGGEWVLLLPTDPDGAARDLRERLQAATGRRLAVVVTDSLGRPFRRGSVGIAIGAAGIPPLFDQRGRTDLFGRTLEHTETALADQVAALADLVAGQAAEGRPVVVVRGLRYAASDEGAAALVRPADTDLYA